MEVGDELPVRGEEHSDSRLNMPLVTGVTVSDLEFVLMDGRFASVAALSNRLVVPSAFVDPERAEQTMATLCWSMWFLPNRWVHHCRERSKDGSRYNVLCNLHSKFSDAGTSKFLHEPSCGRVYGVLMQVWRC